MMDGKKSILKSTNAGKWLYSPPERTECPVRRSDVEMEAIYLFEQGTP